MTSPIKTSVALCTYNGEKYIAKQLQSILQQTVSVDEIIICDDGSTDATTKIIEGFIKSHSKIIRFYQNETNLSINKNFEKAIALSQGDFIFLSDQDDIWIPNKIEQTLQFFEFNPSAEAVFSNAFLINEAEENIPNYNLWSSIGFDEGKIKNPTDLFLLLKHGYNMVTGATLCLKKNIKPYILPIPKSNIFFHDEWIAIITASRKALFYTNEKLISYRIHSNQQVGVGGNIKNKKIKKYRKRVQHILGISSPKSYRDHRRLSDLFFRNYSKFKQLAQENDNKYSLVNFSEIAQENLVLFHKAEKQLKKLNLIFYLLRKIKDKIKGKRQL